MNWRNVGRLAYSAALLLLSGCAAGGAPAAVQGPSPSAKVIESRPLKVGDTWLFRPAAGSEFTVKVVEVSDVGSVTENSGRPGVRTHADRKGVATRLEGNAQALAAVDPRAGIVGWKFLDFPMWPGKAFSYRVEGSVAWFSMDVTAVKWEQVSVPAGTFEALRIEACYRNESSRWYGCGQTYWYVPEVRTFVKRRTPVGWAQSLLQSDFELIKFTPGGGQ